MLLRALSMLRVSSAAPKFGPRSNFEPSPPSPRHFVSPRPECARSAHSAAEQVSRARRRRVVFNVPGSDERKLAKGAQLGVDCAVLDLEDGVALSEKPKARVQVAKALTSVDFGASEKVVRINSRNSGLQEEDIAALLPVANHIDGILLPKVETREDIRAMDNILDKVDPTKRIKILATIETAKGIVNLKDICDGPRLDALIFGSEDYCADVGATRTRGALELSFARSAVVTHAVAFRLQSIDMVCIDFRDEGQLVSECQDGFNLGFTGKQAIHPSQVKPIITYFTPSQAKIDFATNVIREARVHEKMGKGAFEVEGKVIDMPMILQAQRLLLRAGIDPATIS